MKLLTVPFFISHKGCPHTCSFCDQRIISGSGGNLPTSDEILAKVLDWQKSAPGRPMEVAFFGGTFTALPEQDQERLLSPLQPLLKNGAVTSVRISTRPDYIDTARVKWLAGQGVRKIEIGVQSMDDGVLTLAGRGHDAAASANAICCIRACGLSAGAQLLPGLPGDSPRKSLDSLERVIAAGAEFIRIYPVVVLRGTELARRYEAGDYQPLSLGAGVSLCKLLLSSALNAGVKVIRIGLQADEGLNTQVVLAGCWHPALGQLVRSELYFDLMVQLASGLQADNAPLTVRCHPARISDVIGQRRKNLLQLKERGASIARIVPDATRSVEELVVETVNQCSKGSIVNNLKYTVNEEIPYA